MSDPAAPLVAPTNPYWLYVESTGRLYRPNGSFLAACYSGHGAGLDNPDMETVADIGPIPVGLYSIGVIDDEKGPLTIHLIPDPSNEMFNRSGFLIHGDNHFMNHTGSEGCIVAPHDARVEIAASSQPGDKVKVIARPVAAPTSQETVT